VVVGASPGSHSSTGSAKHRGEIVFVDDGDLDLDAAAICVSMRAESLYVIGLTTPASDVAALLQAGVHACLPRDAGAAAFAAQIGVARRHLQGNAASAATEAIPDVLSRIYQEVGAMSKEEDIYRVLSAIATGLQGLGIQFNQCGINVVDPRRPSAPVRSYLTHEGRWLSMKLGERGSSAVRKIHADVLLLYRPDLHTHDLMGKEPPWRRVQGRRCDL
jgi:hypothetical protein